MKNLFLILVLSTTTIIAFSQVELKGIKLGETNTETQVETSIGGIEGIIFLGKIKDGRVYQLIFVPSEDGNKVSRIYSSDVKRLTSGLEKKFNITFKKQKKDSYGDDYYLKAKSNGVSYFCVVEINEYMDIPCSYSLIITNSELQIIFDKEEQESADSDF